MSPTYLKFIFPTHQPRPVARDKHPIAVVQLNWRTPVPLFPRSISQHILSGKRAVQRRSTSPQNVAVLEGDDVENRV